MFRESMVTHSALEGKISFTKMAPEMDCSSSSSRFI